MYRLLPLAVVHAAALVACSSPPPARGAPPRPVAASQRQSVCSPCESAPKPDTVFFQNGQRCGCWLGQMRCREPKRPKCFLNGHWYSKYWKLDSIVQKNRLQRCTCNGLAWECQDTTDISVGPLRVRFPMGVATLDAEQEKLMDDWARETIAEPEGALALVGIINPAEGDRARELARQRAEAVRDAFVSRGVAPERVTVAPIEPGGASIVTLRPILDPPE